MNTLEREVLSVKEFDIKTKIYFGPDALDRLKALPYHRCLIVTDPFVVSSGLIKLITEPLEHNNAMYRIFDQVVPDPPIEKIVLGVQALTDFEPDSILCVGGGSAIDTAKAIAHGAANADTDIWQFWNRDKVLTRSTPVGVILTIPAAGSEMSNSAVLTNEETDIKRGLSTDLNRPKFAVMNPELTFTLPRYQIACGVTDIMMHTMERYFNPVDNALTDALAEALLRTVIEMGRRAVADSRDYEAMSELMWAGSLSHNGLTGCGSDGGDWMPHLLEHEMGGMFNVTHGAGLAAVWPSWARYVYKDCLPRFVKYAVDVMGATPGATDEETALAGIAAMEKFYHRIGMPINFKELGIDPTDEQIAEMAASCARACGGAKGSAKVLHQSDMEAIYKMLK